MLLRVPPLLADGPEGFTGRLPPASDDVIYSVNSATGELITIEPDATAIGIVGPVGYSLV